MKQYEIVAKTRLKAYTVPQISYMFLTLYNIGNLKFYFNTNKERWQNWELNSCQKGSVPDYTRNFLQIKLEFIVQFAKWLPPSGDILNSNKIK